MLSKKPRKRRPLLKAGEVVYYFENGKYNPAVCYEDQPSYQKKAIYITTENSSKRWVYINGLLTSDQYRKIRSTEVWAEAQTH